MLPTSRNVILQDWKPLSLSKQNQQKVQIITNKIGLLDLANQSAKARGREKSLKKRKRRLRDREGRQRRKKLKKVSFCRCDWLLQTKKMDTFVGLRDVFFFVRFPQDFIFFILLLWRSRKTSPLRVVLIFFSAFRFNYFELVLFLFVCKKNIIVPYQKKKEEYYCILFFSEK